MTAVIYPGQTWHQRRTGRPVRIHCASPTHVGYIDQASAVHYVRRGRFTAQYQRETPRV